MPKLVELAKKRFLVSLLLALFVFMNITFLFYFSKTLSGLFDFQSFYFDLRLKITRLVDGKNEMERLREDSYHYEDADLIGVLELEEENEERNGNGCPSYVVGGELKKSTDGWVWVDTGARRIKLLKGSQAICFVQTRTASEEIEGEEIACSKEDLPQDYHAFASVKICKDDNFARYHYLLLSPLVNGDEKYIHY